MVKFSHPRRLNMLIAILSSLTPSSSISVRSPLLLRCRSIPCSGQCRTKREPGSHKDYGFRHPVSLRQPSRPACAGPESFASSGHPELAFIKGAALTSLSTLLASISTNSHQLPPNKNAPATSMIGAGALRHHSLRQPGCPACSRDPQLCATRLPGFCPYRGYVS